MSYSGNCRLGDLFSSRREKGRAGLPTFSVTLNDGLVNREGLDRKQDTNLEPRTGYRHRYEHEVSTTLLKGENPVAEFTKGGRIVAQHAT